LSGHHNHHKNHSHFKPKQCGGSEKHDLSWYRQYKCAERRRLLWSIAVAFLVMVLEIAGGIYSNSIALLSEAGHMFTHLFALAISYGAIRLASMGPSNSRTFGLYRAEVVASLLNGVVLLAITALIIYESILRLIRPENVNPLQMLVIALIGLFVNVITIFLLEGAHEHDRNIRSVFIHIVADALSSAAVVAGAIIIIFTGITYFDPATGLLISALIVFWAWKLIADSIRVILEIAPENMKSDEIRKLLKVNDSRIKAISDMHVVEITSGMYNFSAHVEISGESLSEANEVIDEINRLLKDKYGIDHTTIQIKKMR
jgi:cobalt-zinc-cadmium efflux system protein